MNQVQEMLKLSAAEKSGEAVVRLTGLFRVMTEQAGFLGAEVLRNVHEPETLVVLHAWRDLADWQAFQASQWKVDFTASRPQGLYDMVPCGMNWRSLEADGAREGALLRREVMRGPAPELRQGSGVDGCQTFAFVDEAPARYRGCALRLTRLSGPQRGDEPAAGGEVIADELYESLITVRAPGTAATMAGSAGPDVRGTWPE